MTYSLHLDTLSEYSCDTVSVCVCEREREKRRGRERGEKRGERERREKGGIALAGSEKERRKKQRNSRGEKDQSPAARDDSSERCQLARGKPEESQS